MLSMMASRFGMRERTTRSSSPKPSGISYTHAAGAVTYSAYPPSAW